MREIQTGFQLGREHVAFRVKAAQAEADELRGHKTIPTLGKCVGVMPERDFFRLVQKYGYQEIHSKEFLKYYNKKFPHLSPNKA